MQDGTAPAPPRRARRPERVADLLVLAILAVVMTVQDPGRTRFDTKLDLVVDPWGFLQRAFTAWDSSAGFGQLQNQAYGYLFPMGPFFGVTHSAGLPAWLAQALWAWLLVATAYLGLRMLASRLGLPWYAAVAGALAFALAPRAVTVIGPISAELLPTALLPWTLLPLARRGGTARRTGFLSALPVLFMGAANATLTIAVLPVTVVWILCRGTGRARLLVWWGAFVAAFTCWWVVPLLVQARFATPFLSYIESGQDTTIGLTPAEVVRGDVHWVAGFVDRGIPWWPAGHEYAAVTAYVVLTLLVAAVGMLGLAGSRMPERRAAALSALAGLVVLAAGSSLAPGRQLWWAVLDGPLAPFRNVHKFDPMLRLPLALGVAAAVAWLTVVVSQRVRRSGRPGDLPSPWPALPALATVALVAIAAGPLASPGIAAGRTWTDIPTWWQQTADWLAGPGEGGRALVVPGSGFGRYLWGRTIDEPLQPVAQSPWAIDNDLPLGSIGSARLLDSISQALRSGHAAPGLAATLARSGIEYVVVRNDIDTDRALAPSRSAVTATLQASGGLELATSFGESSTPSTAITTSNFDRDAPRPAVEVYRVLRAAPMVSAVPVAGVAIMTGGPESLLPAAAAGLLPAGQAVVFTGDSPPDVVGGRVVATDGLLRRDRALGRGDESLSSVLVADEPSRLHRKGTDLIPFAAPDYTTATYEGVAGVRASTSGAFADAVANVRVERQPFSALDRDLGTWWESSTVTGPVGQWWQVDLAGPTDLDGVVIALAQSPYVGDRVTLVELSTGDSSWVASVSADGTVGPVSNPALASAARLRVTAVAADGVKGNLGIREVTLPGLAPSRPLQLPAAPADRGAGTAVVLTPVASGRAPCVIADGQVRCDPTAARGDGDGGVLDRVVTVATLTSGDVRVAGTVRSGSAAAVLFDPVGAGIKARASTWLGRDVRVRPSAAVDGDPTTSWVAEVGDLTPTLTLDWGEAREVSSVRLVSDRSGQQFSRPLAVAVAVAGRSVEAAVDSGGVVTFPATIATGLSVVVTRTTPLVSIDGATGLVTQSPVAVAELVVGGVSDLVYRPDPSSPTGAVCGLGPSLEVDGIPRATLVTTTLGAVLRGDEVVVRPCRGNATVTLTPGSHRVTVRGTGLVAPARLALGTPAASAPVRATVVTSWGDVQRTLQVAAGPEALLRVAESANAGWVATFDGVALVPQRVDGWQQGWIVPAGAGGVVTLDFTPASVQYAGMAAGAVTALIGLVVGLVLPRRGRRWTPPSTSSVRPIPAWLLQVGTGTLLMGPLGLVAGVVAAAGSARRWSPASAFALVAGAAVAVLAGTPAWATSGLALTGALLAVGTALRRRGR